MKNKFLFEMKSRGYLHQCTDFDNLERISSQKSITAYIGFDCTASSLHVGSLLQIMILRLMQNYGHRPIVLLGGGTTLIGDPSGKDSTRKVLDKKDIKKNIFNIQKVFHKILNFSNKKTKPIFVDNSKWLTKLNYIEFLREIGSHFTINKMLSFDSVKLRLEREQSLSYMEFNYMILQAYDFYQLFKNKDCMLQIGGSDQWGNIVNGVDLIKRYLNKDTYGLTTPLITLANGTKMGKTSDGAVWLDKKLLSPYDYWQFWRNTDDRDVFRFLKYFTDIDVNEIDNFRNENINKLKILLANETTAMLHGKVAAKKSEQTAKDAFANNSLGSSLPSVILKKVLLKQKINIIDLILISKQESSKSHIRRLIKGNGIKINNKTVNDENLIIKDSFFNGNFLKLSIGKKRHLKIQLD